MAGRFVLAWTMALMLLALAACGDSPHVRSYRPLPQNLPSNAGIESPNSRPP